MNLPEGYQAIAASYSLPGIVKDRIIAKLIAIPEGDNAAVAKILDKGDTEAAFASAILQRQAPRRGEAPRNKKINPPNR